MVPEEMINFGGSVSGLTVASINLGNAQPKFQQLIKEEIKMFSKYKKKLFNLTDE